MLTKTIKGSHNIWCWIKKHHPITNTVGGMC